MKKNRSADASIRGYTYQFHKSIIQILSSEKGESIQVEGIEDVDVVSEGNTLAIQCKYYEAQTYSPSKIREALSQMLLHFKKVPTGHDYQLFAHFKDQKDQILELSQEELSEILIYKKDGKTIDLCKVNKISKSSLKVFLSRVTITFGPNIENQEKQIISMLQTNLSCSHELAESLYYPRAFSHLVKIAAQKNKKKRSITPSQFISKIENSEYVFNDLYLKHRGMKNYIKQIKLKFKERKSLSRGNKILLAIEEHSSQGYDAKSVSQLIEEIKNNHFQFWDSIPWTICISSKDKGYLNSIKKHLVSKEILFNDGGEPYQFNSAIFNQSPMISRTNNGKGNKISSASFSIRIVLHHTLLKHSTQIFNHNVFIKVGNLDLTAVFDGDYHLYDLTKIKINDLREILIGAK